MTLNGAPATVVEGATTAKWWIGAGVTVTVANPPLPPSSTATVWLGVAIYWIEAGHVRAGEPLTPAQVDALDALDGVLADPGLRVEFGLRRGDLFFVNNRWVLHKRTGFEDHPEPGRRRHLIRLWLGARPGPA